MINATPYAVPLNNPALKNVIDSGFVFCLSFQQFGQILDVEIIFNERGSKVGDVLCFSSAW